MSDEHGELTMLVVGDVGRSRRDLDGPRRRVVCATDVAEALQRLDNTSFDLVVSAYLLPGTTGIDLLRIVRTTNLRQPFVLAGIDMPSKAAETAMRADAFIVRSENLAEELNAILEDVGG